MSEIIDVSGCDYIYKNTDCLCGGNETSSVKCSDNADCMYKQLKRLEQRLIAAEQSEQEAVEIIAELKAKKAKLKEALEKIKVTIEPCKASDSCFTCKFAFCANYEVAKILKEVLE